MNDEAIIQRNFRFKYKDLQFVVCVLISAGVSAQAGCGYVFGGKVDCFVITMFDLDRVNCTDSFFYPEDRLMLL